MYFPGNTFLSTDNKYNIRNFLKIVYFYNQTV